jgi:uncharacterized protein involved in high-affinity Fe2+ transport
VTSEQRRLAAALVVEAKVAATFLQSIEWTPDQTERDAEDIVRGLETAIEGVEAGPNSFCAAVPVSALRGLLERWMDHDGNLIDDGVTELLKLCDQAESLAT